MMIKKKLSTFLYFKAIYSIIHKFA